MELNQIGVIGSGTMGGAIAHQAAICGFDVVLVDVDQRFLDHAQARMEKLMDRSISKGKLTQDEKSAILSRIKLTTNMADVGDCEAVIEAIIEDLDAKKEIFQQLDEILKPSALIASNTSSMSITVLASATNRPEQVAGMHFFNPPQVMRLVEVIRGYKTSDETVSVFKELAIAMKKEPIEVKKDVPGFIVNRIMIPQFIEAIRLVEEGVATPEDIDKAVTLGLNYPMGPFTLQDYAGVDIGLHVMDYFYEEFKDQRFAAPLTLRNLVRAGRVGKKAGAGWYDYNS
ncbi:3-hydroxyacyl-CoA dehydrogenase family protein [Fredinandcohnia sp. QZ13]|uniref:3-hydroxyacyl-CoA dehydrogenase family protein n=1 Tax=Fredinandcohnia sp. QZ13 TaxID=3073144 RepID=UPI0028535D29|nr:3-hydroxyacyl-CoA dehydrogenase family protein [Fredinandcohnia sp. QZ13]MDR4887358.1 3-hydroxyacyl-CoA dehydrogenase family protein [Fredinandcohnia sp. QZ13]